jgi:hypothetical protein
MTERSTKVRYVQWVLELACYVPVAVIAYGIFRSIRVAVFAMICAFGRSLWMYSHTQGKKLAIENMKKYGLNPDRDEAPPSV